MVRMLRSEPVAPKANRGPTEHMFGHIRRCDACRLDIVLSNQHPHTTNDALAQSHLLCAAQTLRTLSWRIQRCSQYANRQCGTWARPTPDHYLPTRSCHCVSEAEPWPTRRARTRVCLGKGDASHANRSDPLDTPVSICDCTWHA